MSEEPLLLIYLVALYAGLLLPIPCIILAWREWTKKRKVPPAIVWRRIMSQVGLLLFTVGLAFAVSVAVAEGRNVLSQQSYYGSEGVYGGGIGSSAYNSVFPIVYGKL